MSGLYRENRTFFSIEDDTWIALALWAILAHTGIVGAVNAVCNFLLEEKTSIDTAVIMATSSVVIFIGTMAAIKRMERKTFLLVVFIAFAWIFSFLVNEDARMLLKLYYFTPVMVKGLCGIICVSHFKNWEKFQKIGGFFVVTGILLYVAHAACVIGDDYEIDYMSFSYNNSIFVIAAFWLAIRKKNVFMWILAIVGLVLTAAVGSRGALLCALVYILLEFVLNRKIHIAAKALFFIAVVVVYCNLDTIMTEIYNFMKQFDYESRTMTLFMEGNIRQDSGRQKIYEAAWEVIKKVSVFGHGMAGSSYPLYEECYGMPPVNLQRIYSHNLFLDLLMEFGLIFGTIMSGCLIGAIVVAYLKCRRTANDSILYLMFSLIIPKLMLSSTYLAEAPFFLFLGLLLNLNSKTEQAEQTGGGAEK